MISPTACRGFLRGLNRLEALARRQRHYASDLAVLGGLAPVQESLRRC